MQGFVRIHSQFISGNPGFNALAVEVRELGDSSWEVVDLFCLKAWLSRPENRKHMWSLISELRQKGYIPVATCPRWRPSSAKAFSS